MHSSVCGTHRTRYTTKPREHRCGLDRRSLRQGAPASSRCSCSGHRRMHKSAPNIGRAGFLPRHRRRPPRCNSVRRFGRSGGALANGWGSSFKRRSDRRPRQARAPRCIGRRLHRNARAPVRLEQTADHCPISFDLCGNIGLRASVASNEKPRCRDRQPGLGSRASRVDGYVTSQLNVIGHFQQSRYPADIICCDIFVSDKAY